MAVIQSLTVTEVSQDIENNTSQIRILWTSTQTGSSYNDYTKTANIYISINGGSESATAKTYTLPKNSTVTIYDITKTVTHRVNGTCDVKVRTWMDTGISAGVVEKSQTLRLTTIPRASVPTLSSNRMAFGRGIKVYTNRRTDSFTHHLYYSVNGNDFTGITAGIDDQVVWVIPYSLMSNIPNGKELTIYLKLYTFSGETLVGSNTTSFTAYVLTNADTQPSITIDSYTPISTLTSSFNDMFIQGKSRLKVDFTAEAKYGASITARSFSIEGETYDSADEFTSEHLSGYGIVPITITATDSRGITSTIVENIDVNAYSPPKIMAANGESDIICTRCDAEGNISDSGTYLKVKARRSYSSVTTRTGQKNFCAIVVRYRASGGEFSEWKTVLDKGDLSSNTIDSALLLDGGLAVDTSYEVQVGAKDNISGVVYVTFNIPTDKIDSHEGNGFFALGKYSEKSGFECAWAAEFYDDVTIRGGAITDFPIEEGTDGIWSYRKWHSGIAECWGLYPITGAEVKTAWGNVYETAINYQTNFPEGLFIASPVTNYFAQTSTGGGCLALETVGETTKDQTCSLFPIRATPQTVDLTIAIRAIGRWK